MSRWLLVLGLLCACVLATATLPAGATTPDHAASEIETNDQPSLNHPTDDSYHHGTTPEHSLPGTNLLGGIYPIDRGDIDQRANVNADPRLEADAGEVIDQPGIGLVTVVLAILLAVLLFLLLRRRR